MKSELSLRGSAPGDGPSVAAAYPPGCAPGSAPGSAPDSVPLLVPGSAPVSASAWAVRNALDGEALEYRARQFQLALSRPDSRPLVRADADPAIGALVKRPLEEDTVPPRGGRLPAGRDTTAETIPGDDLQTLADHLAERLAEAGLLTPLTQRAPGAPAAGGAVPASGGLRPAGAGVTHAPGVSTASAPISEDESSPVPDRLPVGERPPAGTEPVAPDGNRSEPGDPAGHRPQAHTLWAQTGATEGPRTMQGAADRAPASPVPLAAAPASAGSPAHSDDGQGGGGQSGGGRDLAKRGDPGDRANPRVSAITRPKDPLDVVARDEALTLPLPSLPPKLPLSDPAPATSTATTPPAPGAAEVVWRQVQDMALRMAAGTGANGAHQIRMEIDPRLLPGVQVVLQMSAGQMQMEFICASDVSRRRLRAAAQRELGPMAARLGCPVQVTLRAQGPGASASDGDDAEYLHGTA